MLKAILFDMDDTLIDWSQRTHGWPEHERIHLVDIINYVNAQGYSIAGHEDDLYNTIRRLNEEAWQKANQDWISPNYGQTLYDAFKASGMPDGLLDVDMMLELYGWGPFEGVRVFPDVVEVFPILAQHGIQLGMITNAAVPMWMRDKELSHFGLLDYFSHCRLTAFDVGFLKPHTKIFEHALRLMEVQPEEAVFVGDNPDADVFGAKSVGMKAVLRVVHHHRPGVSENLDATPDASIDTLHDLLPYLDLWFPDWRLNNKYDA